MTSRAESMWIPGQEDFPALEAEGGASDLVNGRFNEVAAYTNNAWATCQSYMGQLAATLTGFTEPKYYSDWDDISDSIMDALATLQSYQPDRPSDEELSLAEVTQPLEPSLADVPAPDLPEVPDFTVTPLLLEIPEAPAYSMPADPGDAPPINTPATIPPPDYTAPVKPTLAEITIPDAPGSIAAPVFDGVRPTGDLTPPDSAFVFYDGPYESALAEAIKDYLLDIAVNGGTGLTQTEHAAMHARGRDKIRVEWEAEWRRALTMNKGFCIPPGAAVARLDEVNAKYLRALAQLDYEITIADGERAFKNRQFAIERGIAFEQAMMELHNQRALRAFEAARFAFQAGTEIHNRTLAAFNARLALYQADAQVYQELRQAALVELEAYKVRMEGAKLASDVQAQKIAVWQAEWAAIQTQFQVYAEQLKAVSLGLESDRLRLQAHGMSVDVYKARIEALTSSFNLYGARLAAEDSKVRLYTGQAEAYRSRVEAVKSVAEMRRIEADTRIASNKQQIDLYLARKEMFQANLQQEVERVRAITERYRSDTGVFEAWSRAVSGAQNADVETMKAQVEQQRHKMEVWVKEAEMALQAALEKHKANLQAASELARVAAQVVAAFGGSVTASAGVSQSYGRSWGNSVNRSIGVSSSYNVSEDISEE